MSCRICTKKEKGADETRIYICSTCTATLGSMERSTIRTAIDRLYLAGRSEDAQFVEKLAFGCVLSSSERPRLLKRTVPMKIRRRSF